jgi:type II secretory pathway pseudopilin PulG
MIGLLGFVLAVLASPFKSRLRLEAENAVLRHQLMVLRRRLQGRIRLTNHDRWLFIQMYRWFPSILSVLTIVRPEMLVRWHRAGFRRYWRWKSRSSGGRPQIEAELRVLIRRISIENPLWGALRIHGELLKLGFEVAQSSVAKYMVKRREQYGWLDERQGGLLQAHGMMPAGLSLGGLRGAGAAGNGSRRWNSEHPDFGRWSRWDHRSRNFEQNSRSGISTPWVAGSSPAGIANDFNGFRDFRRSSPCRNVSQLFSSCFNELQRVAATTCDMVATKAWEILLS